MPIDLPPSLPAPRAVAPNVKAACIEYAARYYQIHPLVLEAIAEVEGGEWGTVSENPNGTYDLGIMQINTVNLPLIRRFFPSVTWRKLAYSPCINIGVAAWFLRREINEAGSLWKGVGNYHSKTEKYHKRYMVRIAGAYRQLLARYRAMRGH